MIQDFVLDIQLTPLSSVWNQLLHVNPHVEALSVQTVFGVQVDDDVFQD